jgi:transposase
MDKLPELERVSELAKDALMAALWAEVPALQARLTTREATSQAPRKDAHTASVPPSQTPQANLPAAPQTSTRREASMGRAGGGRPLHPAPDHVIMAQAQPCPHGGGAVQAHAPPPHAV